MITHVFSDAPELTYLRNQWMAHKKALWEIIPTPFQLWKASKEYLALPDKELYWDAGGLGSMIDLSARTFCVQATWLSGNWEIYFAHLAAFELDRRKTPDDPTKEIIFCHYEPNGKEDTHGFDQTEADRHAQIAKERFAARNPVDVAT